MNIELDEVVVQDVSDDALELAAGSAQGGPRSAVATQGCWWCGGGAPSVNFKPPSVCQLSLLQHP